MSNSTNPFFSPLFVYHIAEGFGSGTALGVERKDQISLNLHGWGPFSGPYYNAAPNMTTTHMSCSTSLKLVHSKYKGLTLKNLPFLGSLL